MKVLAYSHSGAFLWATAAMTSTTTTIAWQSHSSFAGIRSLSGLSKPPSQRLRRSSRMGPWTMYNSPSDPPNSSSSEAWSVLSNTERWISNTLADANSNNNNAMNSNPYARKEVSYVCENPSSTPMVIRSIFRLLREAREMGESHGALEVDRAKAQGSAHSPSTLRQTQVVVIPNCADFSDSFPTFDQVVLAINQARRNARDYVTDLRLDEANNDDDDDDATPPYTTSINCAHLHPSYGELTPQQRLEELRAEEAEQEVDVNLQEYKRVRLAARRSPYPTVVIEVRAAPSPEFSAPPPQQSSGASSDTQDSSSPAVSVDDIQKLEALFGKTAHVKDETSNADNTAATGSATDDSFWDAVGSAIDDEVTVVPPVQLAQDYIAQHAPASHAAAAAFTESNVQHVDAAYEFVFTNIAMLQESHETVTKQYLVLPQFLSRAATSFAKFAQEVQTIVNCVPGLDILTDTYHPEHVDGTHRSPAPILALSWLTSEDEEA